VRIQLNGPTEETGADYFSGLLSIKRAARERPTSPSSARFAKWLALALEHFILRSQVAETVGEPWKCPGLG
jgi:hypothetical protein